VRLELVDHHVPCVDGQSVSPAPRLMLVAGSLRSMERERPSRHVELDPDIRVRVVECLESRFNPALPDEPVGSLSARHEVGFNPQTLGASAERSVEEVEGSPGGGRLGAEEEVEVVLV